MNDISTLQFAIYILIGIAVIGVIGALIWTKLIKPHKISYTSTSFLVRSKIKNLMNHLVDTTTISKYQQNITFKLSNLEVQAVSKIAYGKKNLYLISDPLYWNILEVKKKKNKYITRISKKNDDHIFPHDLSLFIKGAKFLKKHYLEKENIILIIPALNKKFNEIMIDNIHFVMIDDLENFILKQEENNQILISEKIISKLESIIILKRNKFLFFKKISCKKQVLSHK